MARSSTVYNGAMYGKMSNHVGEKNIPDLILGKSEACVEMILPDESEKTVI